MFAKLTFFLLYLQIFRPSKPTRYAIHLGAAACSVVYGACAIEAFVLSTPSPGQTFFSVTISNRFKETKIGGLVAGAFGILSDFYILCLPISSVWQLHLSVRRKIGVTAIFMSGLL